MIKCIIIEDEKNAQKVLSHYVEQTSFLEYLGIYESGIDIPLDVLSKVDFIFLDIELPELNGLSFLKTLSHPPKVIITTAYPNFAIEAFEQAVLDYLVKPFSYERFLRAVNRIRDVIISNQDEYLLIYADKTTHKVKINDIIYLKSELDYISVVTKDEKILVLDSLNNWQEKLSVYPFLRIHRSYIINTDKLKKIMPNAVIVDGIKIPVGSTYRKNLSQKMQPK